MADHSNPRAFIGIICRFTFFYYAFESVYKNLKNVEFILDFSATSDGFQYPEWYKEHIRKFFKSTGCHFRDFEQSGLTEEEFFIKYNTLIAPFYGGLIAHECNSNKRKVRVFYGAAKDRWSLALWNVYFDLVLTSMDLYTDELRSLYGIEAETVGDPKHDRLAQALSKNFLAEAGLSLDATKKTLLYAPSWGTLSSEDIMVPQILRLLPQYNVIYKPHHMTYFFRRDELQTLSHSSPLQIVDDTVSLMDLLKLDLTVITDNSSAIFDTLVARKPCILIDMFGEQPDDGDMLLKNTLSSSESLDQLVKKPGREIAPVLHLIEFRSAEQDTITSRIEQILSQAGDAVYVSRQREFLDQYFPEVDGRAGERTAHRIQGFLESPFSKNKLRRFLADYEKRIQSETFSAARNTSMEDIFRERVAEIRNLPYGKKIRRLRELFF